MGAEVCPQRSFATFFSGWTVSRSQVQLPVLAMIQHPEIHNHNLRILRTIEIIAVSDCESMSCLLVWPFAASFHTQVMFETA